MTSYQVMPDLTPEEYEALKSSIREKGVLMPVKIDEDGNILDGYHRAKICDELGISYPRSVKAGLTEEEKFDYALRINLHRRHLTREQRQEMALKLRQRGWSYRQIGEELKVDPMTVRRDISGVENATPEIPTHTTGKDGKQYPATRPQAEQPEQFKKYDVDREYKEESPQKNPKSEPEILKKIADFFKVSIDYLQPESEPRHDQEPEQKPTTLPTKPAMRLSKRYR